MIRPVFARSFVASALYLSNLPPNLCQYPPRCNRVCTVSVTIRRVYNSKVEESVGELFQRVHAVAVFKMYHNLLPVCSE